MAMTPQKKTGFALLGVAATMLSLSFAAVPLYQIFCRVTGFGGTTQTATALPTQILARQIRISFNADTDPNLPWRFTPVQHEQSVRVGEQMLAAYEAENTSDQPVTAMATYNVTPFEAGKYFHKIHCFCFEEQTLQPRQKVNMPISFFIDPAIDEDPHLDGVKDITLSYTFFNESSKN